MVRPNWLKEKGYIHLSRSLELGENWYEIVQKITNTKYISNYGFFPLIHTVISDRKFKKGSDKFTTSERKHTHYYQKTLHPVKNIKKRPLHYASHMDALVFSYYGTILKDKYEKLLSAEPLLNDAVIAYRKIETFFGSNVGKSNIHFAKECFDEIKKRTKEGEEVAVLAVDLKSFFSSLDHKTLKLAWNKILMTKELPLDHYKVYRACTNFKYVLLDDLRKKNKRKKGRKGHFDESKLAEIRKKKGFRCFYESNEDFRFNIKEGNLPIYGNPFHKKLDNGKKVNVGIPQGLPISAVLANIYLYDFDLEVINRWVKTHNIFYRRYSDDIFIICNKELCETIEKDIDLLVDKYYVRISKDKTEKFIFKNKLYNSTTRLECFKVTNEGELVSSSMSYLGFEFRGYHVGIKSTNLSKYYRKIVSSVKRKANRTARLLDQNPKAKNAIFKNQVKKIYSLPVKFKDGDLTEKKIKRNKRYRLVLNDRGFYEFKFLDRNSRKQANFHSYIKRCCVEFETDSFEKQIKKSKHVTNIAINKYLNKVND
ncbi:reverse transcriptase domain-containing protein [Flavobacterium sp. ST-75]|uniref:Reverse transcriptase domain-containing protein n=1 Tax=Flavobacterium rhizophilum TaxID=3163296 RepID=A0ABW8YC09_9FLAO